MARPTRSSSARLGCIGTLAWLALACGSAGETGVDAGQTAWPPATPWWSADACQLPACSEAAAPSIDVSGTWTLTLTTKSTDCNVNVQALDDRLKEGNVHTGKPHALDVAGTCDYVTDLTPRLHDGTFQGSTLVTCEVTQRLQGAVEVDTSVITFDGGRATGTATASLSKLPSVLQQPGDACTTTFDVTMARPKARRRPRSPRLYGSRLSPA